MNGKELMSLQDYDIEKLASKFGCKIESVKVDGDISGADRSETFECDAHGSQPVKFGMDGAMALAKMLKKETVPRYVKTFFCHKCIEEEAVRLKNSKSEARARFDKSEADNKKIGAGMSPRNLDVTFDDFKVSNDKQAKALDTAKRICQMIKNKERKVPNMIITGSVGTGKSMLASAMVNDVFGTGTIAMSTIIKIMREIKGTWRKDSDIDEQKLLDWYISRDILVIDEVGVQFDSDTEKLFIFDLIDGRYQNMRPTIIISNLDVSGIKSCIGERCYDRLKEDGGKLIGLDFESQRGKK